MSVNNHKNLFKDSAAKFEADLFVLKLFKINWVFFTCSSNLRAVFKEAPLADLEIVSLVHPKKHIEQIFNNIPQEGVVGVEKEPYADTMLCSNSKNAILRSCGAGIAAVNNLMKKNERAFCAVRPPGHHAETIRANGFCFINNVAVAAR